MSIGEKAAALRAQLGGERAPETPAARPAPVDRGERLATFPRTDAEELRVTWDQYDGRPYLSLRVWTRNAAGAWWPDKAKGCTVRLRELATFAEAVEAALARAADLGGERAP